MATYAQLWLGRTRAGLEDKLSPDDLASIDALLDKGNPEGLEHRTDLVLRGSRTVWAARRP